MHGRNETVAKRAVFNKLTPFHETPEQALKADSFRAEPYPQLLIQKSAIRPWVNFQSAGSVFLQRQHAAHSEVCRCYRIAEKVGKSE